MTDNKTSDLRFTINTKTKKGNPMIIKICLNDECKNGHNDFSVTGTTCRPFERGDRKDGDWKVFNNENYTFDSGGCIHDEILKVRPDLKLFVDLHLSDSKGVPMYAVENGFYHLKESGIDTAKKYLRLTDSEAEIISQSEDKLHFTYLLHSLKIPQRWQNEANEATKLLEQWTGKTFVDDSKKSNWREEITPDALNAIKSKIDAGFYSTENVQQRKQDTATAKKTKAIEKLKNELDKATQKERNEYNVKMAVLMADLPLDNFIYYTHTNEACFNWLDYNKGISKAQFDAFIEAVDYSLLPKDIKFKLGK